MVELEWTNDMVKNLIQEYRKRPMLWDHKNDCYRVQSAKYHAWMEMGSIMGCDVIDIRKKLNSLFASHRREKARVRSGDRSAWYLYEYFNFLPTHIPNPPKTTTATPGAVDEEEYQTEYLDEDHLVNGTPVKKQCVETTSSLQDSDHYESDCVQDNQEDDYMNIHDEVIIKTEPTKDTQKKIFVTTQQPNVKRKLPTKLKPKKFARGLSRRLKFTTRSKEILVNNLDSKLLETLKLLKKSDLAKEKDECDLFGEYIALALRKHDERTRSMIKQAINNIMFEQEMKKYGTLQTQYVVIDAREENPLLLEDPK